MNADSERVAENTAESAGFDFETVFYSQYARIARVIARLVQDPGRAEELAVESFCRLLRNPNAQGPHAGAWLYRTAFRIGLDELRKQGRRQKYERLCGFSPVTRTPEQLYSSKEKQRRVQTVLARLKSREAELLFLRNDGWSYQEIAEALELNSTSIGTLLRRAQEAFRKEYVKRYGQER